MISTLRLFTICLTALAGIAAGELPATHAATRPASQPSAVVTPIDDATRSRLRLDPFYQQIILADGLPIIASAKCRPEALLEANYMIDNMLAHRPEIRRKMVEVNVRVVVMA